MQWPPSPGPGKKGMNPNGLVLAARTTSQMSMSISESTVFISFTRAMFTARKMFSSSFALSATSAVETSTTSEIPFRYTAAASSVETGSSPPTSFGIVLVEWSLRPGSSRSGLKATKISSPTCSDSAVPAACSSMTGRSSSRVVRG